MWLQKRPAAAVAALRSYWRSTPHRGGKFKSSLLREVAWPSDAIVSIASTGTANEAIASDMNHAVNTMQLILSKPLRTYERCPLIPSR